MTKPKPTNIDHLMEDMSHVYESDDYIFVSLSGKQEELLAVMNGYKDDGRGEWELTYDIYEGDEPPVKVRFRSEQIHHGSPLVEDGQQQGVWHWTFLATHDLYEEDGDE